MLWLFECFHSAGSLSILSLILCSFLASSVAQFRHKIFYTAFFNFLFAFCALFSFASSLLISFYLFFSSCHSDFLPKYIAPCWPLLSMTSLFSHSFQIGEKILLQFCLLLCAAACSLLLPLPAACCCFLLPAHCTYLEVVEPGCWARGQGPGCPFPFMNWIVSCLLTWHFSVMSPMSSQFSLCLLCSVFFCFFTSNLILFVFFKLSFWFLTKIHCSLLTSSFHDLFIFSQLSNWWKDFAPILPAALCCCLLSVAASACCLLLLPAACSLHLLGSSGTRMLGQGPGARVSLSFYELDCVLSSDMTL